MSLNDSFCSSPWFHLRIDPTGNYLPCRWGSDQTYSVDHQTIKHNVRNTSLKEYLNSDLMNSVRRELLNGNSPGMCSICQYEEKQGKVAGRQKQLLKSGIQVDNFEKTFCSSPHWDNFKYSYNNQGKTQTQPVDLQIDLGNTCNSSCIMCDPLYSSRLVTEYQKLHKISPVIFKDSKQISDWTQDPELLDKVTKELTEIDNVKYIHFIGGEPLYMKSFYDICNRIIEADLAKNIIMGTTTNCTVYDERLEHIIKNFKEVHLGLSIETVTPLNDYVRWPSKIDQVIENIKKFLTLREKHNVFISLRITPNLFTIYHIDQLFEFMINHQITAESCNILVYPEFLRMEFLPNNLRLDVIKHLNNLVKKYNLEKPNKKIINRRMNTSTDAIISDLVFEYIDFLENYQQVDQNLDSLVDFLKAFESVHHNNILDYVPEYEEFLRSNGY
jgi:MoaA/NifB/PqqE/SkfB family radical SAM enzyme